MKQEVHCDCGRYLFTAVGTVLLEKIICPGCKARKNVKVVTYDTSDNDCRHVLVSIASLPKSAVSQV